MSFNSACAGCFAGLSCDSRMEILNLLEKQKEMSVLEIAKHFKISQPTITHHLKFLKDMGILDSRKEGRKIFYFIHPKCSSDICNIF